MSTEIGSVPTRFGFVHVSQFVGPSDLVDRRCLLLLAEGLRDETMALERSAVSELHKLFGTWLAESADPGKT